MAGTHHSKDVTKMHSKDVTQKCLAYGAVSFVGNTRSGRTLELMNPPGLLQHRSMVYGEVYYVMMNCLGASNHCTEQIS